MKCRYDGRSKPHRGIVALSKKEVLIPVCPEQLGGLATPREPSERKGNRVFTKSGRDVTENFRRGAEEALKIAKIFGIKRAIFKSKSASCGFGKVYDGTFRRKTIRGKGVAADLLLKNGLKIVTEENF